MTIKDTTSTPRLRMDRPGQFNIVLVNPEIPQNTGNIARLCAATGARLCLVGKLGFSIDEKAVRRAGLDYWHLVEVKTFDSFDECLNFLDEKNPILFSSKATKSYLNAPFKNSKTLVFGAESVGLPDHITDKYCDNQYGIPTISKTVRSLNLANSVSIGLFKALEATNAFENLDLTP